MRVLHVIASIDLSNGGPSKSVSDLAIHQSKLGIEVSILTTTSDKPYLDQNNIANVEVNFVSEKNFKANLIQKIASGNYDILHGHGIWQMPVHYMSKEARKRQIPYIITPRGMLEPWALNANRLKKKLAMILYQKRDLEEASCIHATADMESIQIRDLGFKNSVSVIPNGIDVQELVASSNLGSGNVSDVNKRTLLFLSRIHPKKGIEFLIEAWANLKPEIKGNWGVEIAGNGEENYIKKLNRLIRYKGLDDEVRIIGSLFGIEKIKAYQQADLFVLPTYSENFGIVVAEALAFGVPVITTKGTPWKDLEDYNCGWWIEIGKEPLEHCLEKVLNESSEVLSEMGERGKQLIRQKYSIEAVAFSMKQLYRSILEADLN